MHKMSEYKNGKKHGSKVIEMDADTFAKSATERAASYDELALSNGPSIMVPLNAVSLLASTKSLKKGSQS